jgi:hypothetical protein
MARNYYGRSKNSVSHFERCRGIDKSGDFDRKLPARGVKLILRVNSPALENIIFT